MAIRPTNSTSWLILFKSAVVLLLAISSRADLYDSLANQLVTRAYELDRLKLQESGTNTPAQNLHMAFATAGVKFPTDMTKSMFFNDRTGELHVRATRRDIPKLEKVIEPFLRPIVAPLRFEVSFVELPLTNGHPFVANLGSGFTNVFLLTKKQSDATWS